MFPCECGRSYKYKWNMIAHKRYECGKEPRFKCPCCPYKTKAKSSLKAHIGVKHTDLLKPAFN